jgi:hypothetical protein
MDENRIDEVLGSQDGFTVKSTNGFGLAVAAGSRNEIHHEVG